MPNQGRGWFGDSEGHARAGSKSSGNRTSRRNRSGRKGGRASRSR